MADIGNRSTGFAEDACTRTSTPSSGTTGLSTSSNLRPSGEPGRSQTSAFIVTPGEILTMTSAHPERRVLVGHQGEGVAVHPVDPAEHADDVIEQAAGIGSGEEDGEPGRDHRHHGA